MTIYEGNDSYIFISYAHKDAEKVLPIIDSLVQKGYRVWYDAGIEAGTEWPEYIATHLMNCCAMLAFISQSFDDSQNCRREINFAIDKKKPMLAIYLEEFTLSPGMQLQLGTVQSLFANRHTSHESLLNTLTTSAILKPCLSCGCSNQTVPQIKPVPTPTPSPTPTPTPIPTPTPTPTPIPSLDFEIRNTVLYRYSGESERVVVPDGVTVIEETAFEANKTVKDIVLPDSVTAIKDRAFSQCEALTTITLPKRLTELPKAMCEECTQLTQIELPTSLKVIGDFCFSGCSALATVIMSNSVTTIGESAFNGCKALISIEIPKEVRELKDKTFRMTGLKEVKFTSPHIGVARNAFSYCDSIERVILPDGQGDLGRYFGSPEPDLAFKYLPPKLKTVVITGGKEVATQAFAKYQRLEKVVLPKSIVTIGEGAFEECTALKEIELPEGLITIEYDAFKGCNSLTSIHLPTSVKQSGYHAFYKCPSLKSVYITDLAAFCRTEFKFGGPLENGATLYLNNDPVTELDLSDIHTVSPYVFMGCSSIQSVILDGVTHLGSGAFLKCQNLYEITIPGSIKTIEPFTFSECKSLAKVTVCEGVTTICKKTFGGQNKLLKVTLPSSVENVEVDSFFGCVMLQTVTLPKKSPIRRKLKKLLPKKTTIKLI